MKITVMLALTVIAALLAVLLRHRHPEQGMLLGLAAGVLVLMMAIDQLTPLVETIRRLLENSATAFVNGEVLLKGVGICLLTQTAADACRDAGESALAGRAELVGKVALLALALPLFEQVFSQATALMKGMDSG
ncbi:MAG: stage III sporulation protein AD [Clostridia bacterium]|nr:stage III sporulation protein AD [Clostridia bacterium]